MQVVTLGLVRELKSRGHEPFALSAKRTVPHSDHQPGEIQDYEFKGVPVRRVGRLEEGLSCPYGLNYSNDDMVRKMREYVREANARIVHAMHLQGLSASVLPIFK